MGATDATAFNEIPVLSDGFAPIAHEVTLDLTDIEGEIPKDLTGMYVRNGPHRRFEAPGRYHWFDGDGMLHPRRTPMASTPTTCRPRPENTTTATNLSPGRNGPKYGRPARA